MHSGYSGPYIKKIEASAGSGKTYRLTLEYLKLIINNFSNLRRPSSEYDETKRRMLGSILAVTFTNKAADEMKQRIIENLKKLARLRRKHAELSVQRGLQPVSETILKDLITETGIPLTEIVNTADDVLLSIFLLYSDFNVKTIDSLMSSIIQAVSPELGLHPDYSTSIDKTEELENFCNEFLESVTKNRWDPLERTLNELLSMGSVRTRAVDSAIKSSLIQFYTQSLKYDILPDKMQANTSRLNSSYEIFSSSVKQFYNFVTSPDISPFTAKNKLRSETLTKLYNICLGNTYSKELVEPIFGSSLFSYRNIDNGYTFFKTNTPEEIKANGLHLLSELIGTLSTLVYEMSIHEVSGFSILFADFINAWNTRKKRTIYVDEQSNLLRGKLLHWSEQTKYFTEQDRVPYLYIKMSDRFLSFLFDEFQDTSEMQFKALSPFIDEVFSSSEKSSMLAVGDRKQAIYRWRGGASRLLTKASLIKEIPSFDTSNFYEENLDTNYRSLYEIVDFNNNFWAPENISASAPEAIADLIADNFKHSRQKCGRSVIEQGQSANTAGKPCGYVEITGSTEKDEDDNLLLMFIGQSIEKLVKAGYSYDDIAVLVRKNEDVRNIVEYLAQIGIETVSDESLSLSSCTIINEIVAFMKFLEYPPDDLNFLTFITGRIFNAAAGNNFNDSRIFVGRKRPLYKYFRKNYAAFWDKYIKQFFKSAGLLPPYDFFQDLTSVFRLYENFSESTPFLLKFGDVLHSLEKEGCTSFSAFFDVWKKHLSGTLKYSIDSPHSGNRVKVGTMHKAKGLEFPAVILPIKNYRSSNKNIFLKDGKFYYITQRYTNVSRELAKIYRDEIAQEYIDDLNLLYVAFTRAKETLLIPMVSKPSAARGSALSKPKGLYELVYSNPYISSNIETTGDRFSFKRGILKKGETGTAKIPETLNILSKSRLTAEWEKKFLVFHSKDMPQESLAAERGRKTHEILSHLGVFETEEKYRNAVMRLAVLYGLNKAEMEKLLNYVLQKQIVRFFVGNFSYFNEKELIKYDRGVYQTKRADRLNIFSDRITVIDYKTGGESKKEHKRQVKEYMDILIHIYRDKKLEGFLLYTDLFEIETVN